MSEALLEKADLSSADLRGAILSRIDLSKVTLKGADLTEVDLSKISLKESDLTEVDLSNVDLTKADLGSANLSGANLEGALSLKNADLRGVKGLTEDQKVACRAKGAIFDEDTMTGSSPPS